MKTIIEYPILSILGLFLIYFITVFFGRIYIPEFFVPTAPIILQTWIFGCIMTGIILALYLIFVMIKDFFTYLLDEIWWVIFNIKSKYYNEKNY